MTRIDAYTHVLTEQFFTDLKETYGVGELSGSPDWLWDVERREQDMADFDVDMQVITLALPTLWRGLDPETALPIVRDANDAIRRLADDHPDLFVPVGTIPFATEPFREEFARCVDDLDMAGAQIFSNVDGRPIDGPEFESLYAIAEREDAPLWIHPQHHPWYDWVDDYMDHRLFGWPFDTTLALSRLVFSGIMDRHPDLKIISHHGGGMVPFYGERIRMFYEQRQEYPDNYPDAQEWPDYSKPPVDYFSGFYADTATSGSAIAIDCADSFFDDGHVVFGTDYPFSPERGRRALRRTVEAIDGLEMDDDRREAVYGGNLEAII